MALDPDGMAAPGGDAPEERIGSEGAHLEKQGAGPQALEPCDLLGLAVEAQHELEAEGRLATRPRSPRADRLARLAAERLAGRPVGLLDDALQGPRRPRRVEGRARVGHERGIRLRFLQPEQHRRRRRERALAYGG